MICGCIGVGERGAPLHKHQQRVYLCACASQSVCCVCCESLAPQSSCERAGGRSFSYTFLSAPAEVHEAAGVD